MCSECWIEKAVLWELEGRKGENTNSTNWDYYSVMRRGLELKNTASSL